VLEWKALQIGRVAATGTICRCDAQRRY